jgi:hypothetical protein
MTVVPFVPRPEAPRWRLDELVELDRMMRLLAGRTGARGWETGATERGEPQFYAIGPEPEQRCVACVSRVGAIYVLEDGSGQVLGEARSLRELVKGANRAIPRRRIPLAARAFLGICAGRAFVEEKMVAFEESLELLARVA